MDNSALLFIVLLKFDDNTFVHNILNTGYFYVILTCNRVFLSTFYLLHKTEWLFQTTACDSLQALQPPCKVHEMSAALFPAVLSAKHST